MRLVAALLVAVVALPSAVLAQGPAPAELNDAAVVEREGAVEVWVRLSRAARYQSELIDSPFRLVLDFEDATYRLKPKPVPPSADPVRELRGSQFRKGVARLVIELHRKVAYTIEEDREGLRIVLPRAGVATATRANAKPAPAPKPVPAAPRLHGVIMLDDQAHAYIFDPATRQVRRYAAGDAFGEAVVETIGEHHVVLKTPRGRVEMRVGDAKPDAAPRPR